MKSKTKGSLSDWLTLVKINISLPVMLTAFTGFVLYSGKVNLMALQCSLGVVLLSCASSIINHMQEKDTDAIMKRTQNRPLPTSRISVSTAGVVAVFLALSGFLLLLLIGWLPAILGLFNLAWYNLIYTRLKKITAFAVLPGSLVGAIPPVIGWTAAGGEITHPHIVAVSFFFFMGQVPHFWLLLIRYGSEYAQAGFPSLTSVFSAQQINRLTFVWIAATSMTAILLVLFGVFASTLASIFIFLMVVLLLLSFRNWIGLNGHPDPKHAFLIMNLFYLGMMLVLIGDALAR